MNIAVIKTGGKQYKVCKNDILEVELIGKNKKSKIVFDDMLNNHKVQAEIIDFIKGPKINNLKFKNKTRYTKRIGHRQKYNVLKILDIK